MTTRYDWLKSIIKEALVEAHEEIKAREEKAALQKKDDFLKRRKEALDWYHGLTEEEKIAFINARDIESLSKYALAGLPIQFRSGGEILNLKEILRA